MGAAEVEEIFRRSGAYLEGHFLLTSGLHSPAYLEKFSVLQHPEHTTRLCGELARLFRGAGVETVVGPVTGGMLLAYEVARQLGVRFFFTEREQGVMALRRGFALRPQERVLVVEDVLTTGSSAREVVELCRRLGAEVVGVGVLVDRSGGRANLGVPYRALWTLQIAAWPPEECPLCRQKIPLTSRGSRHL
ncbi:MAG: orotate phosphoribosyltransferase [Bacillota bacterium]|nr:orotate phosphoribosyltransferase [Bacillota bacterium]